MSRKPNLTGEEYNKVFPQRLREIMRSKNITQKDLAAEISKTRQAVSYYMDGSSGPDWETLAKIASFLGVSSDYLLGLSDRKESPEIQLKYLRESKLSEKSLANLRLLGILGLYEAANALLSSENIFDFLFALDHCSHFSSFKTDFERLQDFKESVYPDDRIEEGFMCSIIEFLGKGTPKEELQKYISDVPRWFQESKSRLIDESRRDAQDLAIFKVQKVAVEIAKDIIESSEKMEVNEGGKHTGATE